MNVQVREFAAASGVQQVLHRDYETRGVLQLQKAGLSHEHQPLAGSILLVQELQRLGDQLKLRWQRQRQRCSHRAALPQGFSTADNFEDSDNEHMLDFWS